MCCIKFRILFPVVPLIQPTLGKKQKKEEKNICLTYGLLCQVWVFLFAATILFKSFRMECGLHVLFALQFLLT